MIRSRKPKRSLLIRGRRFSHGLGIDAAAVCVCVVLGYLSTALNEPYLVSALMTAAVVTSVFMTENTMHGAITALAGAFVCTLFANTAATPLLTFALHLCVLEGVALLTGALAGRLRGQIRSLEKQHAQEKLINDINHRLLASPTTESLELLMLESLCELTGKPGVIYVRTADGIESCCMIPRWLIVYPSEMAAARTAFAEKKRCGLGTDVCSTSSFIYFPVLSQDDVLAIAALRFGFDRFPSDDTLSSIELILSQSAMAMARRNLHDRQNRILMEAEKEKIRNDFLRAISHDLRTPLTGIMSACSTLTQSGNRLDETARLELVQDIDNEAVWLLRMVENLLSVTKVSGGPSVLGKTLEPVEEIVWAVAERIGVRYPDAQLVIHTPEEVVMAEMDATLIVQVLINLTENAIKYSGAADAVTELSVQCEGKNVVFTVRDHGAGLSEQALKKLFTASATRSGDSNHGLGIGLSICRSIVKAHGGTIEGKNLEDGGAQFRFTLPMEDACLAED